MTQDADELYSRIVDQIGGGVPRKGHLISFDSQIYYDLGIYGDDFVELMLWMHKEFGVEPTTGFKDYAPPEGILPFFYPIIGKLLGRPKSQYRSLTIRDLTDIIAAGRWPS